MLASLFVVLFVELADQLLEDIAHAQVRQTGLSASVRPFSVVGAEVDLFGNELFDDVVQHVGLRHLADLVAKVELLDDFLDVVGEAVKVVLQIGFQLRRVAQ